MISMLAIVAAMLFAVTPTEVSAAALDRAQLGGAPGNYVYASTSHLQGEQQAATENALAFMVASTSSQQIIERCAPVKVTDTLYRLDLASLKWDWRQFHKVVEKYPPYYGSASYIYHADWLVVQLGDTTEGDAYYRLLLGNANPDRDAFLRFFGTNNDAEHHFGVIVRSRSPIGPAVSGLRFVENRPTSTRGSMWMTRDSAKIDAKSDPLEYPENDFQHDAEELIGMLPKQSITTGQRAALMAFFLCDSKGKRQEEAPPSIVTDHLGFRGQNAIRNVGGCIACHATGYLPPGESEMRALIGKGLDLYATPKERAEKIERFHLSDAGKQLARDNEDIQAGIRLVNGLDGETNAQQFNAVFTYYDGEMDLSRAALEVHCTAEELGKAIAYSNAKGINLGARIPALVHGGTISRDAWEQAGYAKAVYAITYWRTNQ